MSYLSAIDGEDVAHFSHPFCLDLYFDINRLDQVIILLLLLFAVVFMMMLLMLLLLLVVVVIIMFQLLLSLLMWHTSLTHSLWVSTLTSTDAPWGGCRPGGCVMGRNGQARCTYQCRSYICLSSQRVPGEVGCPKIDLALEKNWP